MDSKLAEKLSRILALTTSPQEGEAQAATEMLQKLLTKHNLEIADLEAAGKAAAPNIIERSKSAGLTADGTREARGNAWFGEWKLELANSLAEHFFCYALSSSWKRSVVFIGRPDNVESLQLLYDWLVDQIARLVTSERRAYIARTGEQIHAVRWYKAFTAGAVQRLAERMVELKFQQQADVSTTALAVHHMAEVSDYLESIGRNRVDGKQTKKQMEQADAQAQKDAAGRPIVLGESDAGFLAHPMTYVAQETNSLTDYGLVVGRTFAHSPLAPVTEDSTGGAWTDGALRHLERLAFLGSLSEADVPALDEDVRDSARSLILELYHTVPEELRKKVDDAFLTGIYEGELQVEWEGPGVYIEVEVRSDRRFRLYARIFGKRLTAEVRRPDAAAAAVSTLLNFLP